jgi:hypothetical protein
MLYQLMEDGGLFMGHLMDQICLFPTNAILTIIVARHWAHTMKYLYKLNNTQTRLLVCLLGLRSSK